MARRATFDIETLTEVFEYLDELRESGETNMYGSPAYVEREFDCQPAEAREMVRMWMATFALGSPAERRAEIAQAEGR